MANPVPERNVSPGGPQSQRRQVAVPGAVRQRRTGLLLLGVVLVVGAALGFWLVLDSLDQRSTYLVAARTIERWEQPSAGDFTVVEANIGPASALPADRLDSLLGKWSTGRVPAGTIVTEGLFETPPLSGEGEAGKVLITVSLPASEAPFGTLQTGDTVALLGDEGGLGSEDGPAALGLIGVLALEFVRGDDIYFIVTPEEALAIKETTDRYRRSADRTILKLGTGLRAEDLAAALNVRDARVQPAPLE